MLQLGNVSNRDGAQASRPTSHFLIVCHEQSVVLASGLEYYRIHASYTDSAGDIHSVKSTVLRQLLKVDFSDTQQVDSNLFCELLIAGAAANGGHHFHQHREGFNGEEFAFDYSFEQFLADFVGRFGLA